jgi:hypothetical protein
MGKFKKVISKKIDIPLQFIKKTSSNIDIKDRLIKSLGLEYEGWGVYVNKSGVKYKWDKSSSNFKIIEGAEKDNIVSKKVNDVISKSKFTIPEKLKKYYPKVTDSLKDIKYWKGITIIGNSGGKKGSLDEIGYIGIGLKTNTLIPITRGDEHQNGHDLIEELLYKKLIPEDEYLTFFTTSDNYTLINDLQDDKYKIVFEKYLSYGGDPEMIVMNYGYERKKYMTTIGDFVKNVKNDKYIEETGIISIGGRNIIKQLQKFALLYKETVELDDGKIDKIKENRIKVNTEKLQELAKDIDYKTRWLINHNFKIEGDYKKLGEIILSHNGIKNLIHNDLRKPNKIGSSQKGYYDTNFGDLSLAKKEFDRLGDI